MRERSPIDEVVGEYVQLRNAGGGNLKGLCPFHDEKTPVVQRHPRPGLLLLLRLRRGRRRRSPSSRKIDHLSFAEAVERLAAAGRHPAPLRAGRLRPRARAGRAQPADRGAPGGRRVLRPSSWPAPTPRSGARSWRERGFERADAEHFGVGYAPAEWEALCPAPARPGLHRRRADQGRAGQRGHGAGPIDRFRGRLIWPIRDITGDVIGFGARKLRRGRRRPQIPEHAGDPALQEEPGALRRRPGQARDRQAPPGGRSSRATPT